MTFRHSHWLCALLALAIVFAAGPSLANAGEDEDYAAFEAKLKQVETERGQKPETFTELAELADKVIANCGDDPSKTDDTQKRYDKAAYIASALKVRGGDNEGAIALCNRLLPKVKDTGMKVQVLNAKAVAQRNLGQTEEFNNTVAELRAAQQKAQEEADALKPKAGQEAPTFTLKDLDGNEVKLESLRGKIVLLDFWATWCGPCKAIMASFLKPLHEEFKDRGVVILGVGTNWRGDTPDKQKAFAQQMDYHWAKVFDSDGSVAETYQVSGIPTLVLIDKEGKVVIYGGGGDTREIRAWLDAHADPKKEPETDGDGQ